MLTELASMEYKFQHARPQKVLLLTCIDRVQTSTKSAICCNSKNSMIMLPSMALSTQRLCGQLPHYALDACCQRSLAMPERKLQEE